MQDSLCKLWSWDVFFFSAIKGLQPHHGIPAFNCNLPENVELVCECVEVSFWIHELQKYLISSHQSFNLPQFSGWTIVVISHFFLRSSWVTTNESTNLQSLYYLCVEELTELMESLHSWKINNASYDSFKHKLI